MSLAEDTIPWLSTLYEVKNLIADVVQKTFEYDFTSVVTHTDRMKPIF